jgi:hypothetical protein
MSNDTRTLVERKLSGFYTTVTFEVPWKWFANAIAEMQEGLAYYNVHFTTEELMRTPSVIAAYQVAIDDATDDYDFSYMKDWNFNYTHLFSNEIRVEQERKIRERELEEERIKAEEEAKQARLKASMATIDVPHKKLEKAITILKAAGIIK